MLIDYAPLLLLLVLIIGFAVVNIVLSDVLGGGRRGVAKQAAYECGMEPFGSARVRLSIHFYLVAVLFILFDVESIFLIPWAVTAKEFATLGLGKIVFAEIALFALVLGVGLAFVWRKGGLDWDR
ncbi:MAG: NADH-quinone oxidoreductase subunit A [Planctomycetota bacterium]